MKMGSRKQLVSVAVNHSGREMPEFHIALLGQPGVGKSALTVKYITRRFIMEYDPTLEDTYAKLESIEGQEATIKIMDTYDMEDNNPDRYLKWAHGFVIVYSITNRSSFDTARHYLDTVSQYQRITGKDLPIAVVGNKMDLERYRTVSKTNGESLAAEFDAQFTETSAAEDFESVERMFHIVIRDISRTKDRMMPLQPLFISEDKSGLTGSQPTGRTALRRIKAPKAHDHINNGGNLGNNKKDEKDSKDAKLYTRRAGVTSFKLFNLNKGFKIFN